MRDQGLQSDTDAEGGCGWDKLGCRCAFRACRRSAMYSLGKEWGTPGYVVSEPTVGGGMEPCVETRLLAATAWEGGVGGGSEQEQGGWGANAQLDTETGRRNGSNVGKGGGAEVRHWRRHGTGYEC
jgi:hypothetical protein